MIFTAITIVVVIASILLICVVLIQNSKGGGLASGFSASNQIMGVQKTTDFIEKATWTLVGLIIVLSVFSAKFIPTGAQVEESNVSIDVPAAQAPDFGGDAQ